MSESFEEVFCPLLFPLSKCHFSFSDLGISGEFSSDNLVHIKVERSDNSFRLTFTKICEQNFDLNL